MLSESNLIWCVTILFCKTTGYIKMIRKLDLGAQFLMTANVCVKTKRLCYTGSMIHRYDRVLWNLKLLVFSHRLSDGHVSHFHYNVIVTKCSRAQLAGSIVVFTSGHLPFWFFPNIYCSCKKKSQIDDHLLSPHVFCENTILYLYSVCEK